MDNDIFFKKYLKYKNKYYKKLNGGSPTDPHLIFGMGPVGLYLAIKLLENDQKVIIVENRFLFIRKQILLINNETYRNLRIYVNVSDTSDPEEFFVRVDAPPISNDGKICNPKEEIETYVYSIPIYILQQKLKNYISRNYSEEKCIIISPIDNLRMHQTINISYKGSNIIFTKIDNPGKKTDEEALQYYEPIPKDIVADDVNEFNLHKIKNIFLCTGGRDDISKQIYLSLTNKSILCPIVKNKKYIKYEECKIQNVNDKEIYAYGFIAFLYFKKEKKFDDLYQRFVNDCNFDGFFKIGTTGKKIFQHRYRLFVSSNLLNNTLYKVDPYIYLGIQFSNDEYSHINLKYIIDCIIIALFYYNLNDYIDLDETIENLKFNKLNDIFKINIYLVKNQIQIAEESFTQLPNKPVILMGDGLLRINFFSGTGVNFGIKHVDLLLDKLAKLSTNFEIGRNIDFININTIKDGDITDIFSKSIGSLKFNLYIPPYTDERKLISDIIEITDEELFNRLQLLLIESQFILPILELFSTFKDGPPDKDSNNIYDELIKKIKIRKCSKSNR